MMGRSSFLSYACNSSSRISCFAVLCIISVPVFLVWLVLSATDSSYSSPSRRTWRSSRGSQEVGEGDFLYVANSSGWEESQISLPPAAAPSPSPEHVFCFKCENENRFQAFTNFHSQVFCIKCENENRFQADILFKDKISPSQRVWKIDVKLERLEHSLAIARAAIQEAAKKRYQTSPLSDEDYIPRGPTYRNAYAFHRSYKEMEKLFRVYVYEEGEPPLFHDGPCKNIYSMEGRFINNMEMETRLRTRDPDQAHVHFLPFSVTKMVQFIYQQKSFDLSPVKRTISDYINVISGKYPYWNRSSGADHFMLSCHDWGPHVSYATSHLYSNSIRALCNANTSEGFNPGKDVTLPEINLKTGLTTGIIGGPSASGRPILAFFAGGLHGPIRPLLLKQWKDKDDAVRVYEYLPEEVSYYDMMKKSRFCICPSGYEVASPRIVEAIYLECVPVIISDHYVLPFSDVLNWKAFSVQVSVEEIPNLKKILASISSRQYIRMQRRVRIVQRHFVVSTPPKRFDVFHMILHSIWLRRLNIRVSLQE